MSQQLDVLHPAGPPYGHTHADGIHHARGRPRHAGARAGSPRALLGKAGGGPVPGFAPIRAGRGRFGRHRLLRALRGRRHSVTAGIAVAAAALAATAPYGRDGPAPTSATDTADEQADSGGAGEATNPGFERGRDASGGDEGSARAESTPTSDTQGRKVSAPVRIADVEVARLLHPGDRVDVLATDTSPTDPDVRVVARRARVTDVPTSQDSQEDGALVILRVPSHTATELAGAGARAQLAVTLC